MQSVVLFKMLGSKSPLLLLLTEYKNNEAFLGSEKLFPSIEQHFRSETPGVLPAARQEDLFEGVDTRVYVDIPAEAGQHLKLLAKQ